MTLSLNEICWQTGRFHPRGDLLVYAGYGFTCQKRYDWNTPSTQPPQIGHRLGRIYFKPTKVIIKHKPYWPKDSQNRFADWVCTIPRLCRLWIKSILLCHVESDIVYAGTNSVASHGLWDKYLFNGALRSTVNTNTSQRIQSPRKIGKIGCIW